MTRKSATLLLSDLECAGSTARTAETALLRVPGVARAYVNPATEAAYVEYDAERCTEADLVTAVESIGVHAVQPSHSSRAVAGLTMRHDMPSTYSYSRIWWAFAGFLAIAAFLLFEEHRAHMLGVLPYLLLLACPLLHMFGHGGHGHGGHVSHREHGAEHDRTATSGRESW